MQIRKDLLEKLIDMAGISVEYMNDRWITVHPQGHEKGQPLLVKDGESNKDAIDRKFGGSENKESGHKDLVKSHSGGLLSDMLAPKPQRKQHTLKIKYIRQLMDGTLLYENIKTKSMYILKDNKFYNMKYNLVDRDFEIV